MNKNFLINKDKYLSKLNEKDIIFHDDNKNNQRIIIFENDDTLIIFDNDNIYNFFYKINDNTWDEYYFKYFDFIFYSLRLNHISNTFALMKDDLINKRLKKYMKHCSSKRI